MHHAEVGVGETGVCRGRGGGSVGGCDGGGGSGLELWGKEGVIVREPGYKRLYITPC